MSDQLRAACEHGRYEKHRFEVPDYEWVKWEWCPGGRHLTVGEVIEWIGEQDAGLLERLTDAS